MNPNMVKFQEPPDLSIFIMTLWEPIHFFGPVVIRWSCVSPRVPQLSPVKLLSHSPALSKMTELLRKHSMHFTKPHSLWPVPAPSFTRAGLSGSHSSLTAGAHPCCMTQLQAEHTSPGSRVIQELAVCTNSQPETQLSQPVLSQSRFLNKQSTYQLGKLRGCENETLRNSHLVSNRLDTKGGMDQQL